ncbi:Cyclohexanone monooxygenase [Pyrenophora seminiperda CCB06]|uniref:Cyclohexanone monooxygenase n=1 Tax=Pyrenophora seminiperda CCB06 TaxID=1302712 RepID=A0A3M7M5K7_9PLEO|nr:Cyclohexanone monooxygenase [Pyrenophora seminiperda CCB06]
MSGYKALGQEKIKCNHLSYTTPTQDMTTETTISVPAVVESNEPATSIEQKYAVEAAKRFKAEGTGQYEQLHFSENERLRGLHIASIIAISRHRAAKKTDTVVIEPSIKAESNWGMTLAQGATFSATTTICTPGYLTLEGEMRKIMQADQTTMMKAAKGSIWSKGVVDFSRYIEKWREDGQLVGLEVVVG